MAVVLAVGGCSGAGPQPLSGLDLSRSRPHPVPLHVHQIARRVERLRALRFRRLPAVEVVGLRRIARVGARLRADAAQHLAARPARRHQRHRLARSELALERLAGLLPEPQATEATGGAASAEQIGAAYDYRNGRILLVNRAASSRRQLHLVIAHELTHALEDQHLPLRLPSSRGPSEAAQARRALIEGTATYLAARYDRRYQGNRLPLDQEISGQQSVFAAGGQTPFAVKASTIFDYVAGPLFAADLYRRGGGTWRLVDRALRDPPKLTRSILHPATWPPGHPPRPLGLSGVRPAGNWRRVGGGLAGEQLLLAILGEGAPPTISSSATAGWRGGRFEVWRHAGADCPIGCASGFAGVVAVRLRGRPDLGQLSEAFLDYALLGRLGQRLGDRTWRLADGYAALANDRPAAAIAFAPTATGARALALAAAHGGRAAGR